VIKIGELIKQIENFSGVVWLREFEKGLKELLKELVKFGEKI